MHRKRRNKKFSDDIIPIPDLELATLRELHHGDHLILSNHNILYNNFYGTSQMNTEIALLPHIRREKITITDLCLGKGAFGEVHGGVVRSDNLTEERVAIKVNWNILYFIECISNKFHSCRLFTKVPMTWKRKNSYKKLN